MSLAFLGNICERVSNSDKKSSCGGIDTGSALGKFALFLLENAVNQVFFVYLIGLLLLFCKPFQIKTPKYNELWNFTIKD